MRAEIETSEAEFVRTLLKLPLKPSESFGQPNQADILVSIVDYKENDFERSVPVKRRLKEPIVLLV